jgi:hypothetical protein
MKAAVGRSFKAIFLFSLLLWIAAAPSCASKANPVLSSTGPGGLVAGGNNDGGMVGDILATSDVQDLAAADAISDASFVFCDLLKQDCPNASLGCYPFGGAGRCFSRGGEGVGGSCGFGEAPDSPLCDRGLTCITTSGMGGTCLPLCDALNPTAVCGLGNVCLQRLPGIPITSNVGYCQSA